jgi:hypothetical protein
MIRSFSLAVATIAFVAVTPAHAQKQFVGITGGATVGDFGSVSSNSRWGGTAGVSGTRCAICCVVTRPG